MPKTIVFGNDTAGVIPSALEVNVNRTYNSAHKFRDLYMLESLANDSARTALKERGLALNDCDSINANHVKIEANYQIKIGDVEKRNSKLQTGNRIWKGVSLVLACTVWVMYFSK